MKSDSHDSPHLTIKNFGPIRSGEVSLRPLTVLVGPNNTGKSTLATLVYALQQTFQRGPPTVPLLQALEGIDTDFDSHSFDQQLKEMWDPFQRAVSNPTITSTATGSKVANIPLPPPIREVFQSLIQQRTRGLRLELERCFGARAENLVRYRSRGDSQLTTTSRVPDGSDGFECFYDLRRGSGTLTIPNDLAASFDEPDFSDLKEQADRLKSTRLQDEERSMYTYSIVDSLVDSAYHRMMGSMRSRPYFLPADRAGLMRGFRNIISTTTRAIARPERGAEQYGPLLSGVQTDFLEMLILQPGLLEPWERSQMGETRPFDRIARHIEESFLEGSIEIEEVNELPIFLFRPAGRKTNLPLMRASSTVSELAPLVVLLRNCADIGELLVIEEPEAHLHPAQQVELTRCLAVLANAGLRIVITTHSEWVTEELGNCVRRGMSDRFGQDHYLDPEREVAISPDDVGVWLFRSRAGTSGSTVKEIKIDDSGLYPTGFDEVAIQLHNDWVRSSA